MLKVLSTCIEKRFNRMKLYTKTCDSFISIWLLEKSTTNPYILFVQKYCQVKFIKLCNQQPTVCKGMKEIL